MSLSTLSSPFNSGATWIMVAAPTMLLFAGAIWKIHRREWFAAGVFFAVSLGWLARGAMLTPAAPFNPATLPASLYIPQPDSRVFNGPLIAVIHEAKVLRLEAPSEMAWVLKGNEREVSFEYGYIPEAYEQGRPNGAEFIVELIDGANTRRVFQRTLLPLSRPQDRRTQFSRVILPPFQPGSQLKLRLSPGEHNDNAWDWLFVGNIKFFRSPRFLPSQFPFFEPVPSEAAAPLGFLYQKEGRSTFLQLDAPSRLEYLLTGKERRLTFSFGMLPGAYQNGGGSDGADFRVELHQSKKPARIIFERRLQPAANEADRGPQRVSVPLPPAEKDARLILTVGPGPSQSNAWDWSYITRLKLE